MLMAIVGQFDQNLKDLEKLPKARIFFGEIQLLVKEIKKILYFSDAIKFLIDKYLLTNLIEKGDIMLSVKKSMKLEKSNIKSFQQLIKTPENQL